MQATSETTIRERLLSRRARLEAVNTGPRGASRIDHLLMQVDTALEELNRGEFGICEVCNDPVEQARLLSDPLLRHCLDHLTPDQRRALEYDLDLSSRIQRGLFPPGRLQHAGWEARFHYEPFGAVSGDYCDLVLSESSSLFFVIGDGAGKGVAASILGTHLRAIFRALLEFRLPLAEMMERANRLFFESSSGEHYCTLVCGRLSASGEAQIVNAGHPAPLHIGDGRVSGLPATGPPVGLFTHVSYEVESFHVGPGEALLCYTDGLTEAPDPDGAEYGNTRLHRWASDQHEWSAESLLRNILEDLSRHQEDAARTDDLTLLALGCVSQRV